MKALLALILFASSAFGQTGALAPYADPTFRNSSGTAPLALGFVCTYAAGSTTPTLTYQDSSLTTVNQNPIRLNSAGRAVNGSSLVSVYLQPVSYKFVLYGPGTGNNCNGTTVGALIRSIDNVYDFGELIGAGLVTLPELNNIVYCVTGANAGAKIIDAIGRLPSTGGTVDCRNLEGAQTISSNVFNGVTKPIVLLLGAARYTVSVTQTPGVGAVIKGSGWTNAANATKGDSSWSSAGAGTVLAFSLSSGILFDMTAVSGTSPQLSDMMIIGNGGTSTGISLGDGSHGVVQANWGNLLIANCNTGYLFTNVEDSTFISLRSRGNSSGIQLGLDTNQNTFYNTEIQRATARGISVGGASMNGFTGLLVQGMTAGDGIYLNNIGANNNSFRDIWFENSNAGLSHAINVVSAVQTVFSNIRIGTQYDGISIGASGTETTFEYVRNIGCSTITNAGNSSIFIGLLGGCPATFTDTGANTIYLNDPNLPYANATKLAGLTVNTIATTGDTAQSHLMTGSYSPTFTSVGNIASHTVYPSIYMQLGDTVVVGGLITVAATTSGNVGTQFTLSLPVYNGKHPQYVFGNANPHLIGLAGAATFTVQSGTDVAVFYCNNIINTDSEDYYYTFIYNLQ